MNASHDNPDNVWVCPSAGLKGDAGTCEYHGCSACWDPSIEHIDYSGHSSKNAMMERNPLQQQDHDRAVALTQMRLAERKKPTLRMADVDLTQFGLGGQ